MPEQLTRIEYISETNWRHFDRVCDKWINLARSTDGLNRARASAAINQLYGQYDLPNPAIIWCQSPWQMDLMSVTLEIMLGCEARSSLGEVPDHSAGARWLSFFSQLNKQYTLSFYADLTSPLADLQTNFSPKYAPGKVNRQRNDQAGLIPMRLPVNAYREVLSSCLDSELAIQLLQYFDEHMARRYVDVPARFFHPRPEDMRYLSSRISKVLIPAVLSFPKQDLGSGGLLWRGAKLELDEGLMRLFLDWRSQDSRWSVFSAPNFAPLIEFLLVIAPELRARPKLSIWPRLAEQCSTYLFFKQACFACERPIAMHFDESNRLHSGLGPALEFSDGTKVYAWNGTIVGQEAIEMTDITIDKIHSENNLESRRVMIERLGVARYITESGAAIIDQDDYGVLYCQAIRGDEPIIALKVTNATAEPDGTFKEYFLRVPPQIMTARQAAAWTFGMRELDYAPEKET